MSAASGRRAWAGRGPSLFDPTFDEAMALLEDLRGYAAEAKRRASPLADQGDSWRERRECFRVTARLAHVMAWLLAQRAVQIGAVAPQGPIGVPAYRLGDRPICMDDSGEFDPAVPDDLRELLARSLALYRRVARLDDQAAARAPQFFASRKAVSADRRP